MFTGYILLFHVYFFTSSYFIIYRSKDFYKLYFIISYIFFTSFYFILSFSFRNKVLARET